MPKILVNLFFRVTRMTDEDGRIERVRDVENIVKIHQFCRWIFTLQKCIWDSLKMLIIN